MDNLGTLAILLLPLVALWLLVLRPAQRRQRALAQLRERLQPGQEVMTTSGLYGTIRLVDGDLVHLEVADGVVLRVATGAVAAVVEPGAGAGTGVTSDTDPGDAPEDPPGSA